MNSGAGTFNITAIPISKKERDKCIEEALEETKEINDLGRCFHVLCSKLLDIRWEKFVDKYCLEGNGRENNLHYEPEVEEKINKYIETLPE